MPRRRCFSADLEQPHQILGLFLDFEIAVADDAERTLPLDHVAGEQTVDEQANRVLEQDEAGHSRMTVGGDADETFDLGRHADKSVQWPAIALARQLQRERKAQIGNERERVRRVNRHRRQNREDVLHEIVVEPGALVLADLVAADDDNACLFQIALNGQPTALLVMCEFDDDFVDAVELLGGRPAVRAHYGDASADLPLEARDADHEEFIEIVRRDRQETELFEHRMVRIVRLFHHPPVELKPAEFAVDEAFRRMANVRRRLRARGDDCSRVEDFDDFIFRHHWATRSSRFAPAVTTRR